MRNSRENVHLYGLLEKLFSLGTANYGENVPTRIVVCLAKTEAMFLSEGIATFSSLSSVDSTASTMTFRPLEIPDSIVSECNDF